MRSTGFEFPVVNAGISGDSTDNGLARLDKILRYPVCRALRRARHQRRLDASPRGPTRFRSNLARIIVRGRAAKARVVLAGMKIPPWFRRTTGVPSRRSIRALAREYDLPLVPFLLEGRWRAAIQPGRRNPPERRGNRVVADVVWPVLEPVLRGAAR